MSGIRLFALRPLEVGDEEWSGVLRPVLQVGSGEHLPVVHLVARMFLLRVVSGKEPQSVAVYEHGWVGSMNMREERIALCCPFMFQDISPFLLQAFHLVGSNGAYRAVARREVLAERQRLAGECRKVF